MQDNRKRPDQANTTQPKLTTQSRALEHVRREFPPGVNYARPDQIDQKLLQQLVDVINCNKFPCLLFGPPGCGKTFALAVLYVSYYHRLLSPQWIQLEEFCRQINQCRTSRERKVEVPNPNGGPSFWRSEIDWFRIVSSAPVLFVDDAGLRAATDSTREICHKLFSQRTPQEPTFITSNLSPEELKGVYDSRIVSRLCQGTVINFRGKDRRLSHAEYLEIF